MAKDLKVGDFGGIGMGGAGRRAAKANKRALKAANKPTNKTGSKADRKLRSTRKSVNYSKEEAATLNDYYYGMPDMIQVNSRITPANEARSVRVFKPKPTPKNSTGSVRGKKAVVKKKSK